MPGRATSDHSRALPARPQWRQLGPRPEHGSGGPHGWLRAPARLPRPPRPGDVRHPKLDGLGGVLVLGCRLLCLWVSEKQVDIHLAQGSGIETGSCTGARTLWKFLEHPAPNGKEDPSTSAVQTQRPAPAPAACGCPLFCPGATWAGTQPVQRGAGSACLSLES